MNNTPKEIELLFENNELEIARFLIYIYLLSGKRRGVKLEEYIYYEMVHAIQYSDFESDEMLRFRYFKISKVINSILIYLVQCNYISISDNKVNKFNDLQIIMQDKGKKLVVDLQSIYFIKLKEQINAIKENRPYSRKAYKEVLEVLNAGN